MNKKSRIAKPEKNSKKAVEFDHVLRSAKIIDKRLLFDGTFLLQPKQHQNILMAARKGNCSLTIMNFNRKSGRNVVSTHPVYNKDNKCYTGAFESAQILTTNRTKDFYRQMRKRFNQRIYKQLVKSKQYIYTKFYKPVPLSNFCQVCKLNFQNYFFHIKQQQHIRFSKQPQVRLVNEWLSQLIEQLRVQSNFPLIQYDASEHQQSQNVNSSQDQVKQYKISSKYFSLRKAVSQNQVDQSQRERQQRQTGLQKMILRSKAQTSYRKIKRDPFFNQIICDQN